MDKVAEYRAQEMLCRVRASFDRQHHDRWLEEAEEWRHRAQEENGGESEASISAGGGHLDLLLLLLGIGFMDWRRCFRCRRRRSWRRA